MYYCVSTHNSMKHFLALLFLISFTFSKSISASICDISLDSTKNLLSGLEFLKARDFDSSIYYLKLAAAEYVETNNQFGKISTGNNLALNYLFKFDLPECLKHITASENILDSLDSTNKEILGMETLYVKARYYRYLEDEEKGMQTIKKCGKIYKRYNCPINFESKLNYVKGNLLVEQKKYIAAINAFEKSRVTLVLNNKSDSLKLASIYSRIGVAHYYNGDLDMAINKNKISVNLKEKLYGENDISMGSVYLNFGVYYYSKIDYEKALEYLIKAENVYLSNNELDHPNLAGIYNVLGTIYMRSNDFYQCELYFQKSLSLLHSKFGKGNVGEIPILMNLSALYQSIEKKSRSETLLHTAIAISKRNNHKYHTAQLKIKLLEFYVDAGRNNRSLEILSDIKKSINLLNNDELRKLHCLGGRLYHALGDFNKSEYELRRSHFFCLSANNERNIKMCRSHLFLSDLYYSNGMLTKSISEINQGIQFTLIDSIEIDITSTVPTLSDSFFPFLLSDMLLQKCKILVKQYLKDSNHKHLAFALQHYLECKNVYDNIRQNYNSEYSKLIMAKVTNSLFKEAVPLAHKLYEITNDYSYLETAFLLSESNKSMILLEALNELNAKKVSFIPDSLLETERQLLVDITYFKEQLYYETEQKPESQDSLKILKFNAQLFSKTKEYNSLRNQLESKYPLYADLKFGSKTPTIDELNCEIPQDMALIEYFVSDSIIYTYLFQNNELVIKKNEFTYDLKTKIDSFNNSIKTNKHLDFADHAFDLFNLLIHPIYNQIQGKRLIIIPDGHLNYIPFGLLTPKKRESPVENYYNTDFLFEEFPITYNYSATLYLKGKNRPIIQTPKKNFVGFAPKFNNESIATKKNHLADRSKFPRNFQQLPWAKKEVIAISNKLNGDHFIDQKATKSQFLKVSGEYNILHLATHAFSSNKSPEYSGLVFYSEDSVITDQSYLHTSELYNLKLNAQMAVLSACETGIGTMNTGEGLMCLARGFSYAGCPTLVASKWKVNDESTARLMEFFYDHLKNGLPKDIALQKAKKDFLENMSHFYAKPMHWGGMSIIGNENPVIEKQGTSKWVWWPIVGTLIIILPAGFLLLKWNNSSISSRAA